MHVRHVTGTCFEVASESGGEPYVVDIGENGRNGVCNCPDFRTRRQQLWDTSKQTIEYEKGSKESTRCKHVNAVILHLGNTVAQRIAAARP